MAPRHGTVGPLGTLDCVVEVQPSAAMPAAATFNLAVADGATVKPLAVRVRPAGFERVLDSARIIFDTVGTHAPAARTCVLRNVGTADAFFAIGDITSRPERDNTLTVHPAKGCVRAGDFVEFTLTHTPHQGP